MNMPFGATPIYDTKFCRFEGDPMADGGARIAGYASVFGMRDSGGDVLEKGAFAQCLARIAQAGGKVKMLWQHNPAQPIGIWDEIAEDPRGLLVRGRILTEVQAGREALALLEAGAIDGLSIGYRALRSEKAQGGGRRLIEVDLWEVSLVTFPMLPQARVQSGTTDEADLAQTLAETFRAARDLLA